CSWYAARPAPGDRSPLATALQAAALAERFRWSAGRLAEEARTPVADVDPRVAVSAVQVGLVSRLWSAALAPALLLDWVPDLRLPALVSVGPPAGPWHVAPAGEPAGRSAGASATGRAA